MSRLDIAESLGKAALEGAETLGAKLLGDAAGKTVRAGEALSAGAAMKEPTAAMRLAEEAIGGGSRTLSLSASGQAAALRRLAEKEGSTQIRQASGLSYVDGGMTLVSRERLSAGRQAALEEKLTGRGIDVDQFEAARRIEVVSKTGRKTAASAEDAALTKPTTSAEIVGASSVEKAAAKKEAPIAKPAIIRPAEPQMPTREFELANERKIVSKLDDGAVLTEYPQAALPFRFRDPLNPSKTTSYGESVYTVKQLPDGSITIGNPEGITRIGRNFEKARNTLGLETQMAEFTAAPKWFQAKYEHLADVGVPTWMRGDSSWIYGQANAKGIKPVEAAFGSNGYLTQLKFDVPVKVASGPFKGLVGDAMGVAGNNQVMLINTSRMLTNGPERYIYTRGAGEIQAWTTANGRRQLLIPEAFKR